ncbi:hypothetical protein [Magnetospirillum aberrantis]|uniref:Uncharacterized protein n=1 Tax=Magnetospirillum aberrantis SpK TaxID=908842 RepID=A0A7C9USN5_9PROT|nr:hypothetical protein [Magnetospirillum aberrantis]NFV79006.1 hypothetical protein [Magnetospirillum aberrantis SpK]
MTVQTADSDVKATIEYLPGTLVAALDESWSAEDGAEPGPRWRRRPSRAKLAAMKESQDSAAAAERWARPFRSAESPVLYTLMCQMPQCGSRKTVRSKGLWSGDGKGYIAPDSHKVIGLDHRYVQWLDGTSWHGLHLDFDRPVRLDELDGRVNVVVFAPGTYDVERQTYTSGCHTLSVLGVGHSIPMHLATTAQKQGIKRLVKAAIQKMDADPAGSTGRVKNPLCEKWEIHILREQPFGSLSEIGTALGLNDGSRRQTKPANEPTSTSKGIGPVVAELAGKLLRDRGGPQGWQDNAEIYVHAVIESSLERLGLTCDRAKVAKTGGAIAREFWRTYDATKAGAPRREKNAGRLAGALEDVAPEDRKAAAGRWRGEQMERQAAKTRQRLKDAYDTLVWRAKGSWEEVSQADLATLAKVSIGTVKHYWSSIRQHFLGVAEKREKQTSQQSALSSLNKTVSLNGVAKVASILTRGVSQSLTSWLASLADACPVGLYPVPVMLVSHALDWAPILPGATVLPLQAPRPSGRDARALRDADPMGWDACPF